MHFYAFFTFLSNCRDPLQSFYLKGFRERRRWESNPRMMVLQTIALPLGYSAVRSARGRSDYALAGRVSMPGFAASVLSSAANA